MARAAARLARTPPPVPERVESPNLPPSRRGMVHTAVYLRPETHRSVGQIALNTGKSRQELMLEAVMLLLARYR